MGIASYFPRFVLPGAPVSKACEWPEGWKREDVALEQRQPGETPDTQPSEERTGAVEEVAVGKVDEKARPREVPAAETVSDVSVESRADVVRTFPADEIRFQLACIRVNDALAIINAMPHLGPQQLSGQHRSLLENLLRAAGIECAEMRVEDKPFRWPLMEGEHVEKSRTAAAAALTAYLEQKLADWQFTHLLVMGEHLITHVFSNDDSEEKKSEEKKGERAPTLDEQRWKTGYTRSLDEILNRPVLKREVWKDIRTLLLRT